VRAPTLVAPLRFELRDVTPPDPRFLVGDEALLRVLAGGICGSDLPRFRGNVSSTPGDNGPNAAEIPGYPMHEVVGEVVATRDSDLEIGQRVVGWVPSFRALSEQVIANSAGLHPIGIDRVPAEQVMMQPLACVLHAVSRLGDLEGRRVAVIGLGPIGLLFAHVLHSRGVAHVTGVDRVDRSEAALPFCIDEVVTSSSARWATEVASGERPDIIIDAVGHQVSTLNHEIDASASHGTIFYFGMADDPTYPVDFVKFLRKKLTLIGGTTPVELQRKALAEAETYLRDHPQLANVYVSHRFVLEEAQAAYLCANEPGERRYKVVVTIDGSA
jgi:L-iditol 2-dehydrogenase